MNEPDNTNNEETKPTDAQPGAAQEGGTHPICQNAKDQEKCEEFAERLGEANENIDKRAE